MKVPCQKLGGWKDSKMVRIYAGGCQQHPLEDVKRTGTHDTTLITTSIPNPSRVTRGPLAQLAEQLTLNQ